jgi:hypothetical protein
MSADTIGKLLALDIREFWKGAAVALLATNLPTMRSMFSAMAHKQAGGGDKDGGSP